MSFHVYLEPELQSKLEALSRKTGRRRNALVREAIREYVFKQSEQSWPDAAFDFEADPSLPPFETYRSEFLPERDNIFSEDS